MAHICMKNVGLYLNRLARTSYVIEFSTNDPTTMGTYSVWFPDISIFYFSCDEGIIKNLSRLKHQLLYCHCYLHLESWPKTIYRILSHFWIFRMFVGFEVEHILLEYIYLIGENCVGDNFRHLKKNSSLFPDEIFPR